MTYVTFILNEETGAWEYANMKLYELKDSQWKLLIEKEVKVFPSIYDVLAELYTDGYSATFKLPISMEDVPNKC